MSSRGRYSPDDVNHRQKVRGFLKNWTNIGSIKNTLSPHLCGPHLSQEITVEDLEHFIEAKLAQSLHGVADEGGGPALGQSPDAIFPYCHCEAVTDALVFIWAHLVTEILQ